jgi:hypothetical protein
MKTTAEGIVDVAKQLQEMLLKKNAAYGDSAASPMGVFAKDLPPEVLIHVRIDDKLKRIRDGHEYPGDDTVFDLAGYLVLLLVVREQQKQAVHHTTKLRDAVALNKAQGDVSDLLVRR